MTSQIQCLVRVSDPRGHWRLAIWGWRGEHAEGNHACDSHRRRPRGRCLESRARAGAGRAREQRRRRLRRPRCPRPTPRPAARSWSSRPRATSSRHYLAEILQAEGLNAYATADVSALDATLLADYKVVVLGETALTAGQVTDLTGWVDAGGNLIAMRPDAQLFGLLGVTVDRRGNRNDQYLKTDGEPGRRRHRHRQHPVPRHRRPATRSPARPRSRPSTRRRRTRPPTRR